MIPSTVPDRWSRWPAPVLVVLAAALAAVLLRSIGVAQWLELRRHLARAEWWVAATTAAWCVGLLVFAVVTTPLWQPGQSAILVIAIGA
jgi:hypothetical protein